MAGYMAGYGYQEAPRSWHDAYGGGQDVKAEDLILKMLGTNGSSSSSAAVPRRTGLQTADSKGAWRGMPGSFASIGGKGGRSVPPPPPPPPQAPKAAEEGFAFKELLSQVAPQARITENGSRLTSKASARIMEKVFASNGQTTTNFDNRFVEERLEHVEGNGRSWSIKEPGWITSTDDQVFEDRFDDEELPEWALDDVVPGGSDPLHGLGDDDDEDQFMQRWNGLFAKSSPLVQGTATDPFKDHVREKGKVSWKEKKDRRGHRARYQQRRQQREYEALTDLANLARKKTDPADEGVSVSKASSPEVTDER
mmetsp:Transcript_16535/g.28911  ORF Transcript_16535/g.28911 Transcript_16535/m.28911 type:complete len:310 (+) Transcript_16535:54-983(+)